MAQKANLRFMDISFSPLNSDICYSFQIHEQHEEVKHTEDMHIITMMINSVLILGTFTSW